MGFKAISVEGFNQKKIIYFYSHLFLIQCYFFFRVIYIRDINCTRRFQSDLTRESPPDMALEPKLEFFGQQGRRKVQVAGGP